MRPDTINPVVVVGGRTAAIVTVHELLVVSCFFFSSRRRHTRCLSDWSSDVCSSDLGRICVVGAPSLTRNVCNASGRASSHLHPRRFADPFERWTLFESASARLLAQFGRSEERRVGKGGRYRGARSASRKKQTDTQPD